MGNWMRTAPDRVVGMFADNWIDAFRAEFAGLQRLVRRRLGSMPVLLPFGGEVAFAVAATPPEDGRLRALLACFCPPEDSVEPEAQEWVWQWWEAEVWQRLDLACQAALPLLPEQGGCLEIRTPAQVMAVTDASIAVAAVATYRGYTETDPTLREDYADFATDLNDMVQKLFTVAASPPLPRG